MLTRLFDFLPPKGPPSALLVVSNPDAVGFVHIVPEDGDIEHIHRSSTGIGGVPFRFRRSAEQSREVVGTITLRPSKDESTYDFLADCIARARKIIDDNAIFRSSPQHTGGIGASQLVDDILRPAALDAIRALESRASPKDATQTETYHVYIVYLKRASPGRISAEGPTSLG